MDNKFVNRRKYKRYATHQNTFVMCFDRIGLVTDISEGGMAISITDIRESISVPEEAAFHCESTNPDINGLPLKLKRTGTIQPATQFGYITQTLMVEFDSPNNMQQKQIRQHISKLL